MSYLDTCNSADDVLRQTARVMAFRSRMYSPPPPDKTLRQLPEALVPNVAFEVLVREAYPLSYEAPENTPITVDAIQRVVCSVFSVRLNELLSSRRLIEFIMPRHLAMALAKRLTTRSYPEIGRMFNGRDHTTIINACQRMKPIIDMAASQLGPKASLYEWVRACFYVAEANPHLRPYAQSGQRRDDAA